MTNFLINLTKNDQTTKFTLRTLRSIPQGMSRCLDIHFTHPILMHGSTTLLPTDAHYSNEEKQKDKTKGTNSLNALQKMTCFILSRQERHNTWFFHATAFIVK